MGKSTPGVDLQISRHVTILLYSLPPTAHHDHRTTRTRAGRRIPASADRSGKEGSSVAGYQPPSNRVLNPSNKVTSLHQQKEITGNVEEGPRRTEKAIAIRRGLRPLDRETGFSTIIIRHLPYDTCSVP